MYRRPRNYAIIFVATVLTLSLVLFAGASLATPPSGAISVHDPPTITLLQPAGPVKTPINVKGTGFTSGATVNLLWFGFILDVPGISGHIGYYPIRTGIIVPPSGNFSTTIVAPYDFSDILHFVNATQNGVGTGIVNATFTIVPSLQLSPQKTVYKDGQEVLIHVYGAPLGAAAIAMGLRTTSAPGEATVLRLTYDNNMWGFVTSHLATEGPIVTAGFTGGDIGGNATIRFKAVGGNGYHDIRGYVGSKDTPPYLPCEIGGEVKFYIGLKYW